MENNTKHTAGPWTVNRSVFSTSDTAEDHIGTPCHTCAVVYTDMQGNHQKEQQANARLIAAAPDLLAALRDITDLAERYGVGEHCDGNILAARNAIAKAEGGLQ